MPTREKDPEPREGNQKGCIKCHRLLPASAFMRDVTGNLTTWCDVCRDDAVRNWGVDRDQVEMVHALYLLERFLAKEAETVMLARINMDMAKPEDLAALRNRIHQYNVLRHSRIQERVRRLFKEHREFFYQGIRMEIPDLGAVFPAASRAA